MTLNNIRVGFYNLNYEKGFTLKIISNKLISWFTSSFKNKFNGKWRNTPSHCELIYTNCNNHTKMFSADLFKNKVRIKDYKPKKESQWQLVGVEINKEQLVEASEVIESLLGKKYDLWALLFFVTGINFQNSKRWFCSEVLVHILSCLGNRQAMELTPHKTSPKKLYETLTSKKL